MCMSISGFPERKAKVGRVWHGVKPFFGFIAVKSTVVEKYYIAGRLFVLSVIPRAQKIPYYGDEIYCGLLLR